MTVNEIMKTLQAMGSENIKKIFQNHGVKEPLFGVKIGQLKTIQKKIKTDYILSKNLYLTGNADAMYLAGLIADDLKMTKADLETWVKLAVSPNISEYTVPWVASGSNYGFEIAMKWIDSKYEHIATAGWATLSHVVSLKPDTELPLPKLKVLLERVEKTIHTSPNRVRYAMNGFIISLGTYVISLTNDATATAKKLGTVSMNENGTIRNVPSALDYIKKTKDRGGLGKKKKMVKC